MSRPLRADHWGKAYEVNLDGAATPPKRGYRLTPSWALLWTLVVFAFALGYAWHFAQVETHPQLYVREEQ